jgi:hypothetical protein
VFFVALGTSTDITHDQPTVFDVSRGLQKFLNTGLFGDPAYNDRFVDCVAVCIVGLSHHLLIVHFSQLFTQNF